MKKIKKKYEKAVNDCVEHFKNVYEINTHGWIGDTVGEVLMVGDSGIRFREIKYIVDNDIDLEWFKDWEAFLIEFGEKCYYPFDMYCAYRKDAEKDGEFCLSNFEKELIYKKVSKGY